MWIIQNKKCPDKYLVKFCLINNKWTRNKQEAKVFNDNHKPLNVACLVCGRIIEVTSTSNPTSPASATGSSTRKEPTMALVINGITLTANDVNILHWVKDSPHALALDAGDVGRLISARLIKMYSRKPGYYFTHPDYQSNVSVALSYVFEQPVVPASDFNIEGLSAATLELLKKIRTATHAVEVPPCSERTALVQENLIRQHRDKFGYYFTVKTSRDHIDSLLSQYDRALQNEATLRSASQTPAAPIAYDGLSLLAVNLLSKIRSADHAIEVAASPEREELFSAGLIRKHRDYFSRYFTVKSKREYIDQLLGRIAAEPAPTTTADPEAIVSNIPAAPVPVFAVGEPPITNGYTAEALKLLKSIKDAPHALKVDPCQEVTDLIEAGLIIEHRNKSGNFFTDPDERDHIVELLAGMDNMTSTSEVPPTAPVANVPMAPEPTANVVESEKPVYIEDRIAMLEKQMNLVMEVFANLQSSFDDACSTIEHMFDEEAK